MTPKSVFHFFWILTLSFLLLQCGKGAKQSIENITLSDLPSPNEILGSVDGVALSEWTQSAASLPTLGELSQSGNLTAKTFLGNEITQYFSSSGFTSADSSCASNAALFRFRLASCIAAETLAFAFDNLNSYTETECLMKKIPFTGNKYSMFAISRYNTFDFPLAIFYQWQEDVWSRIYVPLPESRAMYVHAMVPPGSKTNPYSGGYAITFYHTSPIDLKTAKLGAYGLPRSYGEITAVETISIEATSSTTQDYSFRGLYLDGDQISSVEIMSALKYVSEPVNGKYIIVDLSKNRFLNMRQRIRNSNQERDWAANIEISPSEMTIMERSIDKNGENTIVDRNYANFEYTGAGLNNLVFKAGSFFQEQTVNQDPPVLNKGGIKAQGAKLLRVSSGSRFDEVNNLDLDSMSFFTDEMPNIDQSPADIDLKKITAQNFLRVSHTDFITDLSAQCQSSEEREFRFCHTDLMSLIEQRANSCE